MDPAANETVDWRDPVSVGKFIVSNALMEDRAELDAATGALDIEPGRISRCLVRARENAVVAGWFLLKQVFDHLSSRSMMEAPVCRQSVEEGRIARGGDVIGVVEGHPGILLRGERVALNLLGKLSGIATLTRSYVERVEGHQVEILDTRKTTPCFRALEKYAVRIGGGVNHRFNLVELAMIKDNHLAVAGGAGELEAIMERLRDRGVPVEVEVDSLAQLDEILVLRPERILLDNMTVDQLARAVETAGGSGVYLEASGGITLENLEAVAGTGVNGISSGALTHSAPSADIGFDWGIK